MKDLRPIDLNAEIEKRIGDPVFVRELIATMREEISDLTKQVEERGRLAMQCATDLSGLQCDVLRILSPYMKRRLLTDLSGEAIFQLVNVLSRERASESK